MSSSSDSSEIGVVGRGTITIDGRLLVVTEKSGVHGSLTVATLVDDWSAG
jgi:hypothetical protein